MSTQHGRRMFITAIILLEIGMFATLSMAKDVPRMTKEELKASLDGGPDVVIIDVRSDGNWKESDMKIRGAVREDYKDVNSWANKYSRDKLLVLYCA